ncbi:MAG: hypothetical protein ACOC7K_00600 [bacterium]
MISGKSATTITQHTVDYLMNYALGALKPARHACLVSSLAVDISTVELFYCISEADAKTADQR